MGEGLSGWVAHSERPIVNGNPTVEPNLLADSGLLTANSSALSIPLSDLSGVVFGVLTVYSCKNAAFSKDHLRILQAMQSKFSQSLQSALRFRGTEAGFDELTHLPGMPHFFAQIDAEIRKAGEDGSHFGVVLCDLNSFKAVNDQHGRAAGDRLLKMIAEEFRECCRPGDTVGRMGGDEFVFLFPSMDFPSVHRPLDMVEEAVQRACGKLDMEVHVSTSIGEAFFPEDGASPEALLDTADRRMYLHKRILSELTHSRESALESLPAS
jgi:diguanylate cyclase (GGDEF)-like protein